MREKTAFTSVELLTVLAIIAMLIGLLIPALSAVRNIARETKQRAQFTTIELALTAFKSGDENDYGDYPPSDFGPPYDYCGAQKLAEALLGWDLLGFHPKSAWRADGYDGLAPNGPLTYDPDRVRDNNGDGVPDTLDERRDRYLELTTANAFRLGISAPGMSDGLFDDTMLLRGDRFVLCDSFGVKKISLIIDVVTGKTATFNAGTPILYYRANMSSKTLINNPADFNTNIYNIRDNGVLVSLGRVKDGTPHQLWNPDVFYSADGGVVDLRVVVDPGDPTKLWPYRPDSYILISAGADGEYGTGDDITNFGN